jgi:hypothetical protein
MPFNLTKRSLASGKEHTLELPLNEVEFGECMKDWKLHGRLIQDAFPTLSNEQREFIMTGIIPEEWAAAFPEEDEEDPDHGGTGNYEAF